MGWTFWLVFVPVLWSILIILFTMLADIDHPRAAKWFENAAVFLMAPLLYLLHWTPQDDD